MLHERAHGLVERAKTNDLDTSRATKLLEQARGSSTGSSRIYYYEQAIAELDRELGLTDEVVKLVSQVNAQLEARRTSGIDVSAADELFERAKLATQHESAIHFLKKCLELLE